MKSLLAALIFTLLDLWNPTLHFAWAGGQGRPQLSAISVLAAGKGGRMKSPIPKVLHEIQGKPMIVHILKRLEEAAPEAPVSLVVGYEKEQVQKCVLESPDLARFDLSFVFQLEQKGTGHAAHCVSESEWANTRLEGDSSLLILPGDLPLISKSLIQQMLLPLQSGSAMRLLTAILDQPQGYGRIVRSESGNEVLRIVEEKDATEEVRQIKEVGLSIYLFNFGFLKRNLPNLKTNNAQGEYYLTDLVELAHTQGLKTEVLVWPNTDELKNVNTPAELEEARFLMESMHQRL